MGLKVERWWQIAWIIVSLFLSSLVEASDTYDQDSLDTFLCKQANKVIEKPRTGVFYNISLPGNFTGIEISVVRFRTVSFWLRGVNYSFFNIPKRVVPQPNRKRMAILYENLGNWSSYYYNVPNHTMLAPVFGVIPYTSSETTLIDCDEKMNLIIQGKPIRIKFPHIMPYAKNVTPICVNFGAGGTVKFRKMIKPHVCEVKSEGHYTIVVPSTKSETQKNMRKGFNIWWVLGFVICFVGLVVLGLVLIIIVKVVKRRKIRKMQKFSEKGEAFDTFWIGESKVPFALMMRTQPVLENEDVPH